MLLLKNYGLKITLRMLLWVLDSKQHTFLECATCGNKKTVVNKKVVAMKWPEDYIADSLINGVVPYVEEK